MVAGDANSVVGSLSVILKLEVINGVKGFVKITQQYLFILYYKRFLIFLLSCDIQNSYLVILLMYYIN